MGRRVADDDPNPTQAEVDAVARQLLATVDNPRPRQKSFLFVSRETSFGTRPADGSPTLRIDGQDYKVSGVRMRVYPEGCTCPKLPADGTAQTYDLHCPILGHRRLAAARRHRSC